MHLPLCSILFCLRSNGVAERRVFFCKTWFDVLRSNLSGFCGLSTDALAICDSIAAEKSTHCAHRVWFIDEYVYRMIGWQPKAQGIKLRRKSCDLVTLPFRCALGSSVSVTQWIVVSCCFLCCVAWGLYSPGLLLRCYDIAYYFVSVNLRSRQGFNCWTPCFFSLQVFFPHVILQVKRGETKK